MRSNWRDQWARMGLTLDRVLKHGIRVLDKVRVRIMWFVPHCYSLRFHYNRTLSAGSCVLVGKNLLGMMFNDKRKMEKNVYHMLTCVLKTKRPSVCVCRYVCVFALISLPFNFERSWGPGCR